MSETIFDQAAFEPVKNLVKGPFHNLNDLQMVESVFRAMVLHDKIVLHLNPRVRDEDKVPTSFIIDFMPMVGDFGVFAAKDSESKSLEHRKIVLSPQLLAIAAKHSNAGPGSNLYEAHLHYLQKMMSVEIKGGSAVMGSEFGREALITAQKFPDRLFSKLDAELQQHARRLHDNGCGFVLPPILGIVLQRCTSREDIWRVLRELREELATARKKVWELIMAYRNSANLGEILEIERELEEASKYFLPGMEHTIKAKAIRVLWDIIVATSVGATVGTITGNAAVGAISGMIAKSGITISESLHEFGGCLFHRGALDLANKVRLGVREFDPKTLSRILSESEKIKLGIA